MRSFRRSSIWLLLAFVCLGVLSCAPAHTQATQQSLHDSGSTGPVDKAKTQLSREQILEVADAVARERGYFPEAELRRIYDEGNARWKRSYGEKDAPGLEGHDYQVVIYLRGGNVALDGELVVMVDRNTGVVLKALSLP